MWLHSYKGRLWDSKLQLAHVLKTAGTLGYGSPLQYSCLENPMDGGAWWAATHGVSQSRTRLKRLRSSSRYPWLGTIHRKFKFSMVQRCIWDQILNGLLIYSFTLNSDVSVSICHQKRWGRWRGRARGIYTLVLLVPDAPGSLGSSQDLGQCQTIAALSLSSLVRWSLIYAYLPGFSPGSLSFICLYLFLHNRSPKRAAFVFLMIF